MKKIEYFKPEIKLAELHYEQLLAGSLNLDENGGSGQVEDGDATGDALGNKGGSFWDDEN